MKSKHIPLRRIYKVFNGVNISKFETPDLCSEGKKQNEHEGGRMRVSARGERALQPPFPVFFMALGLYNLLE